jgi:hypothetical protein
MRQHRSPATIVFVVVSMVVAACTQGAATTASPTSGPSTSLPTTNPTILNPTTAPQPTTALMGAGAFHNVDGVASGQVQLIVTPAGAYEVVLEQFKIASIEHINVVLVANTDVSASSDVDPSKLLDLGPLKATEGMQDFPIPADMAGSVMDSYHTVVIWDTEMTHVIAAAPLQ